MTDVLCTACGKKLYDAQTNLRYWFKSPQTNYIVYGCIHCGWAYTFTEYQAWPTAIREAPPDVPAFDAQSEARGLCPPTVFRRFRARLDELMDKHRDVPDAQALLDEVWAEWRAENK